ncbi:MAG: hypothetical protein OJI67_17460, partial [Prosthecobacter sp.]|nr:hypothetical protein [Prosthecobacter sp.]
ALHRTGPAKVWHVADFLAALESARPKTYRGRDANSRPEGERMASIPLTRALDLPSDGNSLLKRPTMLRWASDLMIAPLYTRT